jgi:hypothetical protein
MYSPWPSCRIVFVVLALAVASFVHSEELSHELPFPTVCLTLPTKAFFLITPYQVDPASDKMGVGSIFCFTRDDVGRYQLRYAVHQKKFSTVAGTADGEYMVGIQQTFFVNLVDNKKNLASAVTVFQHGKEKFRVGFDKVLQKNVESIVEGTDWLSKGLYESVEVDHRQAKVFFDTPLGKQVLNLRTGTLEISKVPGTR